MEICLIRHALAVDRDPQRWSDDRDLPLSPAGAETFRLVARGLARIVPAVETVWSSPYRHAKQSTEILQELTGWPAAEDVEALAPGRDIGRAYRLLTSEWSGERLALVGHGTGLERLAGVLLLGHEDARPFTLRSGGLAYLEVQRPIRPASARLAWLATPEMLCALAA